MSISQITKLIAERRAMPQEGFYEEKRAIDKKIESVACRLMTDPLIVNEERQEALFHLRGSIPNTYSSVDRLYLNLSSIDSKPSAMNQVYGGGFCDPVICNYHSGMDSPTVLSRLPFSAVASVIPPRLLKELGGGLNPDNIDVYCKIQKVFSGHIEDVQGRQETLVRFHRWLFKSVPHGRSLDNYEDKQFPRIGVFPSFGVTPALAAPAPFNRMAETEVYVHGDGLKLLSPNNAHIGLDIKAPFHSMWIAARQGDRACISKVIMIPHFMDFHGERMFPELKDFLVLGGLKCRSLEEFTKKLIAFRPVVEGFCERTFNPIIEAIELGQHAIAAELLDRLPPTFKGAVYEQLWMIKGSPMGVHDDFGGASFKHDPSLAPKFHATKEEKIQALQQTSHLVIKELIDDTLSLHLYTKPLLPSEEVHRLRKEAIDGLFTRLAEAASADDKRAVLSELDTFCAPIFDGAKASHDLFGKIYHLHKELKDLNDDYKEPKHPRFGEAAFLRIDGVQTIDEVVHIAMSDLKQLILSKM